MDTIYEDIKTPGTRRVFLKQNNWLVTRKRFNAELSENTILKVLTPFLYPKKKRLMVKMTLLQSLFIRWLKEKLDCIQKF